MKFGSWTYDAKQVKTVKSIDVCYCGIFSKILEKILDEEIGHIIAFYPYFIFLEKDKKASNSLVLHQKRKIGDSEKSRGWKTDVPDKMNKTFGRQIQPGRSFVFVSRGHFAKCGEFYATAACSVREH